MPKCVRGEIMNISRKTYSPFTLLDILCSTIGYFLGIYIRTGDFTVLKTTVVYKETYFILVLAIIAIAFFLGHMRMLLDRVCKCYEMCSSTDEFGYGFIAIFLLTYTGRLISKMLLRKIAYNASYRNKLLIVTTFHKAEKIDGKK